ncbi:nucleoside/nucleotide kinase family protein [Mycolicibacterium austroafricanum]|uniref:nucleoside/nucleotide kinase family protein n=1 Tax=Mycolicibacterium austroafricanum TaxID=39687 RepID=UPI001CA34588|nr:nucleoside/nucleotide kinase family protein [Mycolicibacterium austroafricanum]QZT64055.1 nucleoside/nucleotide kinase family protein [Mycolicibacterium austroafricanum]
MSNPEVLESLAADAVALGERAPRAVLGIAGCPGAGKSTLVQRLLERIGQLRGAGWAAHIPMDGFHLSDDQLRRLGRLGRKGAPDTFDAAGYAHLLQRARRETAADVYAPGFDRTLEQPLAAALVVHPTARLVITEGNYLLLGSADWPRARQAMDEVWFVSADDQIRTAWLVSRHVEFGKSPDAARAWVTAVDQRNAELVSPTATAADRVIVNGAQGWAIPA